MRAWSRLAALLSAPLAMLALAPSGCGNEAAVPDDPPPIAYQAYCHPDSLMTNYARAWNRRDIREYAAHVLYAGAEAAADGCRYPPFVFYLAGREGGHFGIDEEIRRTGNLFSGETGHDGTPGVASVSVVLRKVVDWAPLDGAGEVYGDSCPAGTMRSVYNIHLIVRLREHLPNSQADRFIVTNYQEFYAIPVAGDDGQAWRLWKQHDLGDAET